MAGVKARSGRKSKAEELGLAALMDQAWPHEDRLRFLRHLATLAGGAKTAPDIRLKAGQLLMEYTFGKPRQAVEHSGAGGGPIKITEIVVKMPDDPNA